MLRIERIDDGTGGGGESRGPGSPPHRFLVRIQVGTGSGARAVIGPRAVTRDQARAMMLEALDEICQLLESP